MKNSIKKTLLFETVLKLYIHMTFLIKTRRSLVYARRVCEVSAAKLHHLKISLSDFKAYKTPSWKSFQRN